MQETLDFSSNVGDLAGLLVTVLQLPGKFESRAPVLVAYFVTILVAVSRPSTFFTVLYELKWCKEQTTLVWSSALMPFATKQSSLKVPVQGSNTITWRMALQVLPWGHQGQTKMFGSPALRFYFRALWNELKVQSKWLMKFANCLTGTFTCLRLSDMVCVKPWVPLQVTIVSIQN